MRKIVFLKLFVEETIEELERKRSEGAKKKNTLKF